MYANGAYESFWFPLPIIRTSGCNVLFSVGTSGGITYQILPLLFVINCHVKWKSPIPKGKSFNCSECSTFPWIVEVQLLSRRKPWFFSLIDQFWGLWSSMWWKDGTCQLIARGENIIGGYCGKPSGHLTQPKSPPLRGNWYTVWNICKCQFSSIFDSY